MRYVFISLCIGIFCILLSMYEREPSYWELWEENEKYYIENCTTPFLHRYRSGLEKDTSVFVELGPKVFVWDRAHIYNCSGKLISH